MSKAVHDFKRSLSIGEAGEALYLSKYPHLIKQPPRSYDFLDPQTGHTYELKVDSYDMAKTPNFFMERFSDMHKKSPGGSWQALSKGASHFLYMYSSNNIVFEFNTKALVEALEAGKWQSCTIPNKGWTTLGYKVPREALSSLYTVISLDNVSHKENL